MKSTYSFSSCYPQQHQSMHDHHQTANAEYKCDTLQQLCVGASVLTSWLASKYCQPIGELHPMQTTSIRVYSPVERCSWRGKPVCSRFTVPRSRKAGSCAPMYPSQIIRPQLATSRLCSKLQHSQILTGDSKKQYAGQSGHFEDQSKSTCDV